MKMKKMLALCLGMGLMTALSLGVTAEESTEAASEAAEAAEASDDQLADATDFTFDPETGAYSFTANDGRIGYYFVRMYQVEDGVETGQYVASSTRINGTVVGEVTGTMDLSEVSLGEYHVNLVTFVASGTDYEKPATQTISVRYGEGVTLERPEMLVMTSGNTAEIVVDWYTLDNYSCYQYLPEMIFTFYADAELTEVVFTDTVDLSELLAGAEALPPVNGHAWGWSVSGQHMYSLTISGMDGAESTMEFAFTNNLYSYTLDAGTYYVTCKALARDEYTNDSQESTAVEITLTEEEPTEDYTYGTTELWLDPLYGMERVYAYPDGAEGRVDQANADVTGVIIES